MMNKELLIEALEIAKNNFEVGRIIFKNNDLLLLASCMMAVSMQIYKTQLGSKKVKIILQSAIDRIR